ncbi:TetR family transcriptional regulator [Acrocarpospora phusangensis]|uniref:TetR family transcriptional regulator n=1 Tax=Acrocarpospora phusangensis TaxID=1070424 RepID=A0A919QHZ0_9ACTN|nr:TetR/AcrR family transcriptional regulator [Acrocarpospora phusangensis]GIH26547.1 TetR family transcriptional regulator [Acrocarpospora phusangensis]
MSERTSTESAFAPEPANEDERPRDTRARIQEIALRLFTEQGYEATSLREIAEALGVTKAALYYHFKTKEDIALSMVADRVAFMDDLIDWVRSQPPSQEVRREVVRRYADWLHNDRQHDVMRFMERNQTALKDHPQMGQMRTKMLTLVSFFTDPGDSLTVRLKRTMALFSLHAVWFMLPDDQVTEAERADVSLKVALELIDSSDS